MLIGSGQLALVQAQPAPDDLAHDLGRACENAADARIGVHAADPVLFHVPGAAVQLDALVHHPAFEFGTQQLGPGRVLGRQFTGIEQQHQLVDVRLRRIELDPHRRHLEAVAAAQAELQKAESERAALDVEAARLAEESKSAPADQKIRADQLSEAAAAKQKAAAAAVAAAAERLKKASDVAAPTDLVDIVVSEPLTIRVLPVETK